MKYPYVVILKKTGQRATDWVSALLCLISVGSFAFAGLRTYRYTHFDVGEFVSESWKMDTRGLVILGMAAVLLVGLVVVLLLQRRRPGKVRFRYLLLLAAMGWLFFTPTPWVGFFFLVLTFLEFQTKRPLEIGFDYERVVINSLIKQEFAWSAFANIILKDGLLTLDFKSNRLIQREVAEDDEDDDADEDEFNHWCRERLADVK